MARFFTHYWSNETCDDAVERGFEGKPLKHTADNMLARASSGDVVYVVTVRNGKLFLLGRMVVEEIIDYEEACERLDYDPWEAEFHAIASSSTPMAIDNEIPVKTVKKLRAVRADEIRPLKFVDHERLDRQALRGVVEITPESADLLDDFLEPSDTVDTNEPGEITSGKECVEGATKKVFVNRFERNQRARAACIEEYGARCFVCGFDFGVKYGDLGNGFIEVHHKVPLASVRNDYVVNPISDLVPLCSNCHRMVHLLGEGEETLEELKRIVEDLKP